MGEGAVGYIYIYFIHVCNFLGLLLLRKAGKVGCGVCIYKNHFLLPFLFSKGEALVLLFFRFFFFQILLTFLLLVTLFYSSRMEGSYGFFNINIHFQSFFSLLFFFYILCFFPIFTTFEGM